MSGFFGFASVTGGLLAGGPLARPGLFGPIFIPSGSVIHWTTRAAQGTGAFNAVGYGNGLWVIGGALPNAPFKSSPDTVIWTTRTIGTLRSMHAVAYLNGQWIAAGIDASGFLQFYTSPDGITWTKQFQGVSAANVPVAQGIVWNGSVYVITINNDNAANTPRCYTSPDAVTWTPRNALANTVFVGKPLFTTDGFVSVSQDSLGNELILQSSDGITWTSQPLAHITALNASPLLQIANLGTTYIIEGALDVDGNYKVETATVFSPWNGVLEDIHFGANACTSIASGPATGLGTIALVVGQGSQASYSTDGITWVNENSLFGAGQPNAMAAGLIGASPAFVVVGQTGKIVVRQ